jgi:quercetin dioxygenase-like cupin family protein
MTDCPWQGAKALGQVAIVQPTGRTGVSGGASHGSSSGRRGEAATAAEDTRESSMTTTARATVQHDNERVRVTRWDFEPGTSTGWHVHEYDYVVVPLTDGPTDIHTPDGAVTQAQLRTGESYTRSAGVEHEVINAGDVGLAFVEIELK